MPLTTGMSRENKNNNAVNESCFLRLLVGLLRLLYAIPFPKTITSQGVRDDLPLIAIFKVKPLALGSQVNETVSPVSMSLEDDPHFQY